MRQTTHKRSFKDAAYAQLARIGKALSSPKRLELLDLLCQSDRTVEALAAETGMSVATSQHLAGVAGGATVGDHEERTLCFLSACGCVGF